MRLFSTEAICLQLRSQLCRCCGAAQGSVRRPVGRQGSAIMIRLQQRRQAAAHLHATYTAATPLTKQAASRGIPCLLPTAAMLAPHRVCISLQLGCPLGQLLGDGCLTLVRPAHTHANTHHSSSTSGIHDEDQRGKQQCVHLATAAWEAVQSTQRVPASCSPTHIGC
jgi:hypothetical protein